MSTLPKTQAAEDEAEEHQAQIRARRRQRASVRKRSTRTQVLRIVAVLVLVPLVVIGAAGAYAYTQVQTAQARLVAELKGGADDLQHGKDLVKKASGSEAAGDLTAARAAFESSRRHFTAAERLVQADPTIRAAAQTPDLGDHYVQPRLVAIQHVARMGVALDDTGEDAIAIQGPLQGVGIDPKITGGERLVAVLKTSGPAVARVISDLKRAEAEAALVNPAVLPAGQRSTFLSAKASIASGYAGLQELQTSTPALLDILGAVTPRTYFIEQMNPAELRSGGGFVGSYAVLHVVNGQFSLVKSGNIDDLDYPRAYRTGGCVDAGYYPTSCKGHGYTAPPAEMKDFLGVKSWILADSNFYANFSANADIAETFATKSLGYKPDGVIAIDPYVIASLLDLTGPIDIPEYGFTADSKTFVNNSFEYENRRVTDSESVRKALFTALATPLIAKLTALPASSWQDVATILNGDAQDRHIQVFFNSAAAQAEIDRFGWTGKLNVGGGNEFMYEDESNFGGTKANHFVQRTYNITLALSNGVLHHHVEITLKNSMPFGRYEGQNFYRTYIRLYVPDSATSAVAQHVVGDKVPTDEQVPKGLKLIDGWQQINVSPATGVGQDTVVFEYDTPVPSLPASYTIYWQKQPGTERDKVNASWSIDGQTYKAASDLTTDRIVHLTASGLEITPGTAATAHLPGLSL